MKNQTNKRLLIMISCLALALWSGLGNSKVIRGENSSPVCQNIVIDPVGDFLPTYEGPRAGDLDVVSAEVTFTGTEFLFSGTMDAPIGTTDKAFYVWGVDRGVGASTADFARLALPFIVFDLVVVVRPGGDSVVNDLAAGIVTPLPAENISINGNTIVARVPLSMLPSRGFALEEYMWNLWPRWGGIPFSDPQISDFAPDNRNSRVSADVIDPVGDFLPTYEGPRTGDLDVVSAQVTFTGTEFLFSGTMDAPIGTTREAFYVWGVDRGVGAITANFARLGLPRIVFDLVVIVRPGRDSEVIDLHIGGISTPLPAGNISIRGNTIEARVPLSMLPGRGFAPEEYMWNLWPRCCGLPLSDPQISDFAPDDRNARVCVQR